MAQVETDRQSDADAIYGACRAVCVLALAVACAVLPRACVNAYDEPPPILTPVLAIWLVLCPLAVIAGLAARRLDRDLRDAAAVVLLVPTVLLAVAG